MEKIKKFAEDLGVDYSSIITKVIGVIVILIIIFVIFSILQLGFLLSIFDWLAGQVRLATGLDMRLVKGITSLLMAGIFTLPLGGLFLAFVPIPSFLQKGEEGENKKKKNIKRRAKRVLVMLIFAAFFFSYYFVSQDVYFNPSTGESLRYYSVSPYGEYQFYSTTGFDPVTGDELLPVTKDIILKYYRESREKKGGEQPRIITKEI